MPGLNRILTSPPAAKAMEDGDQGVPSAKEMTSV